MAKIPSMSLAKGGPKPGTPEWVEQAAIRHSSVKPLQLERRRRVLSRQVQIIQKCVEQIQNHKKDVLVEIEEEIESDFTKRKGVSKSEVSREIRRKYAPALLQLEIAAANMNAQWATVEGLTQIVDALTMRHERKVKGQPSKVGKARYTLCGYVHDDGKTLEEINLKLDFALSALVPAGIPPDPRGNEDDLEEEDEDDVELDEEEEEPATRLKEKR